MVGTELMDSKGSDTKAVTIDDVSEDDTQSTQYSMSAALPPPSTAKVRADPAEDRC